MNEADINPELREMVTNLVDEQIADFRQRIADGYAPTRDEILATLDQLIRDRARMRSLTMRQGATLQ